MSSRANSPDDPKWQSERDLISRRRRERHLARLRQLAAEFNLEPPPIEDGGAIAPAKDLPQPAAPSIDSRDRFNERPAPRLASAPASPPVGRLAQELARQIAQSEPKHGMPPRIPIPEPSTDLAALARGRKLGYGKIRDPKNW